MYNCQICGKEQPSIKALELCAAKDGFYNNGKAIEEATILSFRTTEEKVRWLLLNRKGCTGSDQLTVEWYKADFMKLQAYNPETAGFTPFNPQGNTIEEIVKWPSWETLIRARARLQEAAYKRVEEAKERGMLPDIEDLALLPTEKTHLRRRHRESVVRQNIKRW